MDINQFKDEFHQVKRNWAGSPWEWVAQLNAQQFGSLAKLMAGEYLGELYEHVERASQRAGHDFIFGDGFRLQVKGSRPWEDGPFVFQQIRENGYDTGLLIGVAPDKIYGWWIERAVLWALASGQHGPGRDTRWLAIDPRHLPEWDELYRIQDF